MKTRTGKIARLRREIREQLNRHLQDGELGIRLVDWLNTLPEVQAVLAAEFGGRPVSEQNLSEWKQGGYAEWERHQESCALVRQLPQQSNDLSEAADGFEVSHRLGAVLAVELARVSDALLEQATDPQERWRCLRELLRELAELRQQDRKFGWLALERARRDAEEERRDAEEDERLESKLKFEFKQEKNKILAPIWAQVQVRSLAERFGGGEAGRGIAAFILEAQRDLPWGSLTGKNWPHPAKPNQTESNPIKPDQSESRQPHCPCTA